MRKKLVSGLTDLIQQYRNMQSIVCEWDEMYIPPDIKNDMLKKKNTSLNRNNNNNNNNDDDDKNEDIDMKDNSDENSDDAWDDVDKRINNKMKSSSRSLKHSKAQHNNDDEDKSQHPAVAVPVEPITLSYGAKQIAEASVQALEGIDLQELKFEELELLDSHPLFMFYMHREHELWWWLNQIARGYFAIPGANIASERTFHMIRSTVDATRNRLDTSTVSDMITLHESLIGEDDKNKLNIKYQKLLPRLMEVCINKTQLKTDKIVVNNIEEWIGQAHEYREKSSMLLCCN